jgi:allantoin racemase
MTMRLLLANANTSESVTNALATAARAAVSKDTEIFTVTAAHGVPVIQTIEDLEIARLALLEALGDNLDCFDGLIVGVSLDLAVEELRKRWPCPVVGMTGGALSALSRTNRRLGVITFGEGMTALFQQQFPEIDPILIETVQSSPANVLTQRHEPVQILQMLQAAAANLAARGAQVILPIGATVAGLASLVHSKVPVIDPISCASQELERLVRIRRGKFR